MKESIIEKLKCETGKSTSEELFNIMKQEDNQCPYIDTVLTMVEWANGHIEDGFKSHTYEDVLEYLKSCKYELSDIPCELEKIRESIINIRAWGEEWKNMAKYLLTTLPEETVYELFGLEGVL